MNKKRIVSIAFICLGLWALLHYAWYGSLTENCQYIAHELPVPESLNKSEWITISDLAVEEESPERCGRVLAKYRILGTPPEQSKGGVSLPSQTKLILEGILEVESRGMASLEGHHKTHFLLFSSLSSGKFAYATVNLQKETPWIKRRTTTGEETYEFGDFFDFESHEFRFNK